MSEQALDLRRSVQIVRRHRILVGIVAALGLLAGAALRRAPPADAPEQRAGRAADRHPRHVDPGRDRRQRPRADQARCAHRSGDVAADAARPRPGQEPDPRHPLDQRPGQTAAQAEDTANAVADSYVAYIRSPNSPGGRCRRRCWSPRPAPRARRCPSTCSLRAGSARWLGALIGAIVALAISRSDRRLRERDEIADCHRGAGPGLDPRRSPIRRRRLDQAAEEYEPGAVDAWRLRKALHHLGLAERMPAGGERRQLLAGRAVAVLRPRGARPRPSAGGLRRLAWGSPRRWSSAPSRTRTPPPRCAPRAPCRAGTVGRSSDLQVITGQATRITTVGRHARCRADRRGRRRRRPDSAGSGHDAHDYDRAGGLGRRGDRRATGPRRGQRRRRRPPDRRDHRCGPGLRPTTPPAVSRSWRGRHGGGCRRA